MMKTMKKWSGLIMCFTILVIFNVQPIQAADPLAGIQLFPSDYLWNVPVDTLPVSPYSAAMIQTEGGSSSSVWPSFNYAFYVVNNATSVYKSVTSRYSAPKGPYAFPKGTMVVTNGNSDGTCNANQYDCSVVVLNTDTGISYDYAYYDGTTYPDGSMKVGSAAIWPLNDYSLDYSKHGSVTASTSSHLAGEVRYEEIENGVIPHAIQIAVPYTRYGTPNYAWPAQWSNSIYTQMTGPEIPRMGERFRLKASFDISGYSRTNQIILTAMKKYGMIIVDSGDMNRFEMRGFRDSRWSSTDVSQLTNIKITNLEAIDETSLMVAPNSGQARVSGGTLTVTSPNGGENWVQGATPTITWASAGTVGSNVKIELMKAGTMVQTISSQTANDGSFAEWTVPTGLAAGTDYRIRITSATVSAVSDMSNNVFTVSQQTVAPSITPSITVTSPNGGENWVLGTKPTITWTSAGTVGSNVKIELLKAGTMVQTISSQTANDGSFAEWTVPTSLAAGTDYRIRITSATVSAVSDMSNNVFTVSQQTVAPSITPSITVTSPNGGENWVQGTKPTITWTSAGNVGSNVKIELMKAGTMVLTITSLTANDGTFADGTVPTSLAAGTDYRIRITSATASAVSDMSNNVFTVSQQTVAPSITPSITVTSPNGGENWVQGTTPAITWTSTGSVGSNVKIDLLKAGVAVQSISSLTANDGSFASWTVPAGLASGSDYQIRITSATISTVSDVSNSKFSVNPQSGSSTITVISPNGGETWVRGTTHTINWKYTGTPGSSVKITLLKAGVEVGTINSIVPLGASGVGSYNWLLSKTGMEGSDFKVRIQSINQPAIGDVTDGIFAATYHNP